VGKIENPRGFERIEQTPNLTAALQRRRWPAARIEKVMGLNWVSYLKRVWHE
jgi:membrane dipeptidase